MVQTMALGREANSFNWRVANACPARGMEPEVRQVLALQALSGTFTITALAEQAEVSRKFVYQQIDIAQQALEQAFAAPAEDDDAILFHLPVTKKWLRMNVVSLLLNCRSCYRGVIHHFRDCLGCHTSLGTIHNILHQAVPIAHGINAQQALDAIDFGLLDEIFRELLRLQYLRYANPRRWQREAELRQQLHERFHDLNEAVREVARRTVRASSLVENLNSRLRNYFTLRRHLGADYLALLQFYFNHRPFDRSDCPQRAGKSPAELLTGQTHPHWLQMLGYQPFSCN